MNSDEQFKENLNKSVLIKQYYMKVIPLFSKRNSKAIFLDGLFFY